MHIHIVVFVAANRGVCVCVCVFASVLYNCSIGKSAPMAAAERRRESRKLADMAPVCVLVVVAGRGGERQFMDVRGSRLV